MESVLHHNSLDCVINYKMSQWGKSHCLSSTATSTPAGFPNNPGLLVNDALDCGTFHKGIHRKRLQGPHRRPRAHVD